VSFDERPVPPVTLEAIEDLRSSGVRFGLATGRDVCELNHIFAGESSAFSTGILSNGKKIFVDGELKSLTLIDHDGFVRLAEEARHIPNTFLCGYPLETDDTNPVWCFGATMDEIVPFGKTFSFTGIALDEVPDEPIIGATIACSGPQEQLDETIARFAELTPQFDFAQPAPQWCDILPTGLNKGTALDMLISFLSLTKDEVMVFGDADNDLDLLMSVTNSVAVANATPAAKKAARWHVGACADHAVAAALHELAHAARTGELPSFMRE
jgi:hypothetical protein